MSAGAIERTDLEREGPRLPGMVHIAGGVANIVSLGAVRRVVSRLLARRGDLDLWPFIRRADFEAAVRSR